MKFFSALKRLGRSLSALLISGTIAVYAKDEKYILFAPLIQAGAKYLRDKFKLKNIPF